MMFQIVDCHRHYGGSLTAEFIWEVICKYNLQIAHSLDEVRRAVSFVDGEPVGFYNFLNKFNILNVIPWDEWLLRRSTEFIARQLQSESIDYTWMRLSVTKYKGDLAWWTRRTIIEFIREIFEELIPGRVGLVLSIKYESNREVQTAIVSDERIRDLVVGIDLVGDETRYNADFYKVLLRPWRDDGKILFAHVGESCSKENVLTAIQDVGITEICHGINAIDDPKAIELVQKNDLCFHMAISSNYLTGVVKLGTHPFISCLRNGLKVTLGTDDPVQCSTTLEHEYELARDILRSSEMPVEDNIDKLKAEAVSRVAKYK